MEVLGFSNQAENYSAVPTAMKKTLYDCKNVFGHAVESIIRSKDLDEISFIDILKLVMATQPYQARLDLMIIKNLMGSQAFWNDGEASTNWRQATE